MGRKGMLNTKAGMNVINLLITFTLLLTVSFASAQQFENAASYQYDRFDLTPSLDFGIHFNDNITRTPNNEISTWSRLISPKLSVVTNVGASQINVVYRLRDEDFFSSKNDNYTDHFLLAGIDFEINARNSVDITVNYDDSHDARGTGFSIGAGDTLNEPDQFKRSEFDLLYTYGVLNAQGKLELNVNFYDLDYDLNTLGYRSRDRTVSSIGGTFYYKIGATADATFDANFREIDYEFANNPINPLDSTDTSYLVGIRWEATAQTSGFAKIGIQRLDFNSSLREDSSGVDWSAGVVWKPLEYARIEVKTVADTNETNGEGNFIRSRIHSIEWRHVWLQRLRSSARIVLRNNVYEAQLVEDLSKRSDDNSSFRISAYYQFRRWLNFELSYQFDERSSNRLGIDFNRNQFIINALVTL